MKTQPLTSVVIPAYNAELFIERTLLSVLRQTYSNLEIIVVDDGSTDKTRRIAEAAATRDDRIRIICVPNGGVAKARNIGLGEATGEFVAFLDADDLWHPTKIERQVAAMSSERDDYQPAAVYTFSRTIDMDDRVTENGRRIVLSGHCFARYLYARPVGNGSSILVRREMAVAAGGFDPTWAARGLGGCEDLDFELRLAAKYPITSLGLYLVGYREYPGNMSSNTLPMALGAISTIAHHINSHPELPGWVARSARASILEYALHCNS
jgi:glycosyltransferase involved in cell wall biosynthesis